MVFEKKFTLETSSPNQRHYPCSITTQSTINPAIFLPTFNKPSDNSSVGANIDPQPSKSHHNTSDPQENYKRQAPNDQQVNISATPVGLPGVSDHSFADSGQGPSFLFLHQDIPSKDALQLLGRIVLNPSSPLDHFVPAIAQPMHQPNAVDDNNRPGHPETDAPIFVLPELESCHMSESIHHGVNLTGSSFYTRESKQILRSLLGVSHVSHNGFERSFHLTSRQIRTISLTQHRRVFSRMLEAHRKEIRQFFEDNNSTLMWFVTAIKLAMDPEAKITYRRRKVNQGAVQLEPGVTVALGDHAVSSMVAGQQTVRSLDSMHQSEQVMGERGFAVQYVRVTYSRYRWPRNDSMLCRRHGNFTLLSAPPPRLMAPMEQMIGNIDKAGNVWDKSDRPPRYRYCPEEAGEKEWEESIERKEEYENKGYGGKFGSTEESVEAGEGYVEVESFRSAWDEPSESLQHWQIVDPEGAGKGVEEEKDNQESEHYEISLGDTEWLWAWDALY